MGRGLGLGGVMGAALCAGLSGCGPAVEGGDAGEGSSGASGASSSSSGSEPGDPSRPTGAPSATDPTATETSPTGDPDTDVPPDLPNDVRQDEADIDGDYLIAFRTIIAEETPFQFTARVSVVDEVLDMTLVPLSLGAGSTDAPREELPDFALPVENIAIGSDGTFMVELPNTFLPGQANPITGSDVVADLRIVGWFNGLRMCGNLSGQITVPANIDLTGSSLAGVPLDDGILPPVENAACG